MEFEIKFKSPDGTIKVVTETGATARDAMDKVVKNENVKYFKLVLPK